MGYDVSPYDVALYDLELAEGAGGVFSRPSRMLDRVFVTVDDSPIPVSQGWSFSNTADLGYDQLRAVVSGRRARTFAGELEQGSIVKAFTEDGGQVWEGRIPQPAKLTQDGLAHIVAQGHGYDAAKYTDRLAVSVTGPGAWVLANQAPLNFFSDTPYGTAGLVTAVSPVETSITIEGSLGEDVAIAFAAPNMNLTRLVFSRNTNQSIGAEIRVFSANYPDIQRTKRMEFVDDSINAGQPESYDVTMSVPGDVVIIQLWEETGGPTSGSKFTNLRVWGDYALDSLYGEHAVRTVANRLGWDDIGVTGRGAAPHESLDWGGNAAGFMSYVCGLEDWCWSVWENAGSGPVLTAGPYGRRTWEVSAATGARWDLDPLERYKRIVLQFLNLDNSLNQAILEAPDTYMIPEGVNTTLRGSLGDSQSSDGLAFATAWRQLRRALDQRYRGRISFTRARDAASGEEAPFQVRAGDNITITDFSFDGALTLRVHDVSMSESGVTVGIEASSFPLGGGMGGGGGGSVQTSRPLASSTQGTAAYIPQAAAAGSGGGSTSGSGGSFGYSGPGYGGWYPQNPRSRG